MTIPLSSCQKDSSDSVIFRSSQTIRPLPIAKVGGVSRKSVNCF